MIHLDTNSVIAYFNGSKMIMENIKSNIDRISISSIVVAELDYGAKSSSQYRETYWGIRCHDCICGHRTSCGNRYGKQKA